MSEKVSFLFYYNWLEQLEEFDNDSERWNLILNIMKFDKGQELDFCSKSVKHAFLGIKHGLISNQKKYELSAKRSRENGKKHVGKNARISQITQQVFSEPKEPDKSKEIIDKSKVIIDNRKEEIDNREEIIENREESIDNIEMDSITEEQTLFDKLSSIDNWEGKLLEKGSGWIIDELVKSVKLTASDMNEILKMHNQMTSQCNSE